MTAADRSVTDRATFHDILQAECFQDDIFVSTRNVEKPTLSTQEWLDGKDAPLELIDLKPADMKRCE